MANRRYTSEFQFSFEVMPVKLDCNFIVDSTNGNGLGIRSLKGEGISNVWMHTSATPAGGNPNPNAGYIVVQLTDVYNRYIGGTSGFVSPLGSSTTSSVASVPNIITVLGSATLAQWQAVGLPKGVVPALGVSFIASSSALIGGSAQTAVTSLSGIDHIEAIGDPNTTLSSPVPLQPSNNMPFQLVGGYIVLQCNLDAVLTQPANGTVIGLTFYLSNSGNKTQGQ